MNSHFHIRTNRVITCIAIFILTIVANHSKLIAQEANQVLTVVKISGFVKSNIFLDNRQTISAREGHFMLFPALQVTDEDGKDINAKASFNMHPIHSKLAGNLTLAGEIEYTSALFGTPDSHGIMINTTPAKNIRFLLSSNLKILK